MPAISDTRSCWPPVIILLVIARSKGDEAIQRQAGLSIASRSLSSGAHSRDPLARHNNLNMRHDRVSSDHFRREPYPSRRDPQGGSLRRGRGRTWTLSHAACRHVRACQLIEQDCLRATIRRVETGISPETNAKRLPGDHAQLQRLGRQLACGAQARTRGEDVAPRRAAAVRFKKPATGFPARAQFLRC